MRCARPPPLCGNSQAQAQQNAGPRDPREYIGVHEEGGHTRPLLHRGQMGIVRREPAEERQHRRADPQKENKTR